MADIIVEEGSRDDSRFYHIGDGFHYHFQSERSTSIYFRCRNSSCGGRALLRINAAFQHTQPHNHPPDLLYPQVMAARRNIIDQARLSYVSFSQILATERRRIPDRMVRAELTLRRLRPAMHRARSDVYPTLPQSLQELTNIFQDPEWESLITTIDQQDFIYLGSTTALDGSHSVIFMSLRCLMIMRMADVLFADGTFFVKPSVNGCYQVFTIVTVTGHTVLPLCWCLMDSKSQWAYESVLLFLHDQLGEWRFTHVICDYEDAILNAFLTVFGIYAQGCLFHSATAQSRWARTHIGIPIISFYPEVRNVIRLSCSIALLPEHLLQRGLDAIGMEALNGQPWLYEIVHPFLCYIQTEWINHPNRGRSMSVCRSAHRTNNASETNNSRMKRRFGVHHPNIFHFTREISNFEDATIDDFTSLSRGIIPTRHRAVSSISNDAHIARITTELLQVPNPTHAQILHFLSAAANSVEGIVQDQLR